MAQNLLLESEVGYTKVLTRSVTSVMGAAYTVLS